jgi:hypothetical protein
MYVMDQHQTDLGNGEQNQHYIKVAGIQTTQSAVW